MDNFVNLKKTVNNEATFFKGNTKMPTKGVLGPVPEENEIINNFTENYNNFCYVENENNIVINYNFLKNILNAQTYDLINIKVKKIFDDVLKNYSDFNVKVFIKTLTINDIDKHKIFIYSISNILKNEYPNKLSKCIIYEGSYIFANIYSIISIFIDKKTLEKIIINGN